MSEKRRDNKGRVLRNGESQRKDRRFMYKYTDNAGNIKYVYSWPSSISGCFRLR